LITLSVDGENQRQIVAQLKATLDSDHLPANLQRKGEALLARLSSPVRIAFLGLPGSGKTELMNLVAGAKIIPSDENFPSFELSYGSDVRCFATDTADEEAPAKWPPDPAMDWPETTMLRLEYPLAIGPGIALIEVVTDGTDEDLRLAAEWAAERTDIALWCTQDFGASERAAWSAMPDALKDHSFLVVTKADQLVAGGTLAGKINSLSGIVANEFHSMFPVATLQFLNSIDAKGSVAPKIRAATGAGALIDGVLKQVKQGLQTDLDGAMYFLSRYGVEVEADAETDEPGADVVSQAAQSTSDDFDHGAAGFGGQLTDQPNWMQTALDYVTKRGAELSRILPDSSEGAAETLAHCAASVDHLVEIASSADDIDEELLSELEEAAELMVLLGLEEGDEPAADAATLMLQLSREIVFAASK
jgi:hypothetical protein